MNSAAWTDWVERETHEILASGRWRRLREFDACGQTGLLGDRRVVSFAGNDYLGLTRHPAVLDAAHAALDRWGSGSGAARLITGTRPVHTELEEELAEWKRTERALVFPTGFAANLGVLTALAGPGTRICSDQLNHASIIDGCRLSRADACVYRHGDPEDLDRALEGARRALVVTETVFSMDGDVAPVPAIVEVCHRQRALLVLDEAHAVLGPQPDLEGVDALRVGTLSKTLGSLGGYVAGPAALLDLILNRARSFIFTTALTPADAAAALAAIRVIRSAEGTALLGQLAARVERVRPGHRSPIIPFILGSEELAEEAAAELLAAGLLVPAIRPPTVPPGTSRLRVTLSAVHEDADVEKLRRALAHFEGASYDE